MANERYTVPSLDRAIRVLELLSHERDGLSLAELTRRTEIPKSTLFRILTTLQNRGCLNIDEENKRYQLGLKLWELGSAYIEQSDIDSAAISYMKELAQTCGESVFLGMLDEGEVVYVRRIESPRSVTVVRKLGHRAPAYCTATGEAMLAFMPDQKIQSILDTLKLKAYNPKTNTDQDELWRRLKEVRSEGVAVVDGEYNAKLLCVSAPVLDDTSVRAAITVAMLSAEAEAKEIEAIKQSVRSAAQELSKELGHLNTLGRGTSSFATNHSAQEMGDGAVG